MTFVIEPDTGDPELVASEPSLRLVGDEGGSPVLGALGVSASDSSSATLTVTSDASWLSAATTGSTPADLNITADPGGLMPGAHQGMVRVTAEGYEPASIPVTLIVNATQPCNGADVCLVDPVDAAQAFGREIVVVAVSPSISAVSVELTAGGTPVGTEPVLNGSAVFDWDSTLSSDGTVSLVATAIDASATEVGATSTNVEVVNDTTGTVDRTMIDYSTGLITADQFIPTALAAVTAGEVDDRYQSTNDFLLGQAYDPDAPVSGTQLGLTILSAWDEMSPEAQAQLAALGTPVGPLTGSPTGSNPNLPSDCRDDGEFYAAFGPWAGLTDSAAKGFRCVTVYDHATVYWNAEFDWETVGSVTYHMDPIPNPELDSDETVGGPDYIDAIGIQINLAWEFYDDLGYQQPVSVPVYVHSMPLVGTTPAMVLPSLSSVPGSTPFMQFQNNLNWDGTSLPRQALARHEQFHVAQIDTMNEGAGVGSRQSIRWWMEATANWAAHQSISSNWTDAQGNPIQAYGVDDGSGHRYAKAIPRVLRNEPSKSIVADRTGPVSLLPLPPASYSYGSFILAEWFDENLSFGSGGGDGYDAIYRTFVLAQDHSITAQQAIRAVVDDQAGKSLVTALADYAVDNYLMDEQHVDSTHPGYQDPHASSWAVLLDDQRPYRTTIPLESGQWVDETTAESYSVDGLYVKGLEQGGAQYVELTRTNAGEAGIFEITVGNTPDVQYRAMRVNAGVSASPELCTGASDVTELTPGDSYVFEVDPSCSTVALVSTYADFGSSTREVSWHAAYYTASGFGVSIEAPTELTVGETYLENPFEVTVTVSNILAAPRSNVPVTLELPPGLRTSEPTRKAIPSIAATSSETLTWQVTAERQPTDLHVEIRALVGDSQDPDAEATWSILLPGYDVAVEGLYVVGADNHVYRYNNVVGLDSWTDITPSEDVGLVRSVKVVGDDLYATTTRIADLFSPEIAEIWRWDGGNNWTRVFDISAEVGGAISSHSIHRLGTDLLAVVGWQDATAGDNETQIWAIEDPAPVKLGALQDRLPVGEVGVTNVSGEERIVWHDGTDWWEYDDTLLTVQGSHAGAVGAVRDYETLPTGGVFAAVADGPLVTSADGSDWSGAAVSVPGSDGTGLAVVGGELYVSSSTPGGTAATHFGVVRNGVYEPIFSDYAKFVIDDIDGGDAAVFMAGVHDERGPLVAMSEGSTDSVFRYELWRQHP